MVATVSSLATSPAASGRGVSIRFPLIGLTLVDSRSVMEGCPPTMVIQAYRELSDDSSKSTVQPGSRPMTES